jgi:D-sedoheptulose 7-phosphate isomerase
LFLLLKGMVQMSAKIQDILATLLLHYPDLDTCAESLVAAYELIQASYDSGGKILLCGNGGSASDCEHVVGELMKNFEAERPIPDELRHELEALDPEFGTYLANHLQRPLSALSLTSQSALMTAISNDVASDMIFAQQVLGYGKPEDTLIGISTSGNSSNVLHALRVAKAMGLKTIGFTGKSGGQMRDLCDVVICAPSNQTAPIQERHLAMYHALCRMLEQTLISVT